MEGADVSLEVRRVRLALLLRKFGWRSTLAALPFATVIAIVYYLHRPAASILAWIAMKYVLAAVRALHLRRLARRPPPATHEALERRLKLLSVHIALTGCGWGLAPWMVMPLDEAGLYQALMGAFLIGTIATGSTIFGTHRRTVVAFHVPVAAGLIGAQLALGDALAGFLALVTLQFVVINMRWTFHQADLLAEALTARFEKERLAQRLAAQVDVAQQASREKSRFFAAASHDLRQPLHAVALFSAVLENARIPPEAQATVARLVRSVRVLEASLDSMLDVSRLDAGAVRPHPRPVAVHALFLALQDTYGARAQEKGLQLRVRAPGGLAIASDPALLERLLGNLVDNAIKYTQAGGVLVTVRTGPPHARPGEACLEVTDTGIGIAPRLQRLVFDEFYQVDNPQRDRARGLGIGLAVVQRLAQLLGHPLAMASRPGRGTRFRLRVPFARAEVAADPRPALAPPARAWRLPASVLVVDDEADSRDALAQLLAQHGCQVHAAGDVQEAEALLARTAVHAVVADFRLPGARDGLAFLQSLRQRDASVRGLLVTGETLPARIAVIRDSGIPCLFKPVRPEQLLGALAQ
ncbi:MAG: hybrid sensor histidine kinase/response regulator [Ramlibacter sp.]